MMFQGKVDRAMKRLHDDKLESDGELTEEQVETEKEKLEWRDYVAMTVSALIVILPAALIVLLLLAAAGYFFIAH